MTIISEKFEKQIQRIHELIEQEESEITWNDKIPDPDNPEQLRQIDISIKREGKFTIVECRIHQKAQDVKWIEELIGRRLSLKADAVIAVSNAGFTEGAVLKAKQYGIILRDLQGLTQEEVQAWGFSTQVSLTFFEYSDVEITLWIKPQIVRIATIDNVMADLMTTNTLYRIFDMAANAIEEKKLIGKPGRFKGLFGVEGLSVSGANIEQIEFAAGVKKIDQNVKIPSVVAYDAPDVQAAKRNVLIEKVDLGDFEITQSSNKVFVAADLSPIKSPPNCQFRYFGFDFGRAVSMESLEILALPKFVIPIEKIKLRIIQR